jgi:hypothetical protein
MYQDGRWVRSLADTTAAAAAAAAVSKGVADLRLSSAFTAVVQQHASLDGGLTLQSVTTARDGTHK